MKCKYNENKSVNLSWIFINGAWLPAITVCMQRRWHRNFQQNNKKIGGIYTNGTSYIYINKFISTSGGVQTNGISPLFITSSNNTHGGLYQNGSSISNIIFKIISSLSGTYAAGLADINIKNGGYIPSGGALANGFNIVNSILNNISSYGSRAYGSAVNSIDWNLTNPPSSSTLLAEYKFDEGSGTSVIDYSGNSNTATVSTGGVLGTYGLTSGSGGGYVDTTIPMSSVLSIVMHLSPDGTSPGVLAMSASGGNSPQMQLVSNTASISEGQTIFRVDRTSPFDTNSGAEMNSANWPFTVAFVFVNGLWQIYMNGVQASLYDIARTATTFSTSGFLRLFGDNTGAAFHGMLAYALIYSTALSDDDVARYDQYIRNKVASRNIPNTGPVTKTTPLVVLTGNSITNNEDTSQINLKRQVAILKVALAGATPQQVLAKAIQATIPLYRPLAPSVCGIWTTPNSPDASGVMSAATQLGQSLQSAGFSVYLKGSLSHNNGWDVIKNQLATLYADPTTGWRAFANAFIDFSGDADIYADGAYSSLTWYIDGVHINQAAYIAYVYTPERNTIASFMSPIADFSVSNYVAASGVNINFIDTSVGIVNTYLWDFGDSNTSTLQNPSHSYVSDGIYNVNLTVTGPKGTSQKMLSIEISTQAASIVGLSPYSWIVAGPGYSTNNNSYTPSIGDNIYLFVDRSGSNNAPSQTTSNKQPTLQQVSGKYVIRFDKTRGDFIQWITNAFTSFTGGAEIFTVERVIDGGAAQAHWHFGTGTEDYYAFGGSIYESFASTTRQGPYDPTPAVLTNFNVYNVRSVPGEQTCRLNGNSIGTTATNSVAWASVCKFGIGLSGTSSGRELCELILTPPLSNPNRDMVLSYLKTKWGTP